MDRVASRIAVGVERAAAVMMTAPRALHSNSPSSRSEWNALLASRKILQVPPSVGQETLQESDLSLFLILTICGGIGILLLTIFGVLWCVFRTRRKNQTSRSSDEDDSGVTDQDDLLTEDDKTGRAYLVPDSTRSSMYGYGVERKLATSAQLYHYQMQKQKLIALEQHGGAGQSDVQTDASRSTPPPAYPGPGTTTAQNVKMLTDTNRRGPSPNPAPTTQASATVTMNDAHPADGGNEEEFTVFEYPGLVTTVGQVEIDNPLFRAPVAHSADSTDTHTSGQRQPANANSVQQADMATPFGDMSMHVMRQQPDVVESDAQPHGGRRKHRSSSKRGSPVGQMSSSSSDSPAFK